MSGDKKHLVIIGGGITGLAAAFYMEKEIKGDERSDFGRNAHHRALRHRMKRLVDEHVRLSGRIVDEQMLKPQILDELRRAFFPFQKRIRAPLNDVAVFMRRLNFAAGSRACFDQGDLKRQMFFFDFFFHVEGGG